MTGTSQELRALVMILSHALLKTRSCTDFLPATPEDGCGSDKSLSEGEYRHFSEDLGIE